MISETLIRSYRYHRARRSSASSALAAARRDAGAGIEREEIAATGWTGRDWTSAEDRDRYREDARYVDAGAVRVRGYADEIVRLDHKGWFLDEDIQEEVMRGVVLHLPGGRFLAGYADPYGGEGYTVDTSTVYEEEREAALGADEFARVTAEHERDYNRAWHAGDQWQQLTEEAAAAHAEARRLARDLRIAKENTADFEGRSRPVPQSVCDVLTGKIADLRREAKRAREAAGALLREWSHLAGRAFEAERGAFNEAAGKNVL